MREYKRKKLEEFGSTFKKCISYWGTYPDAFIDMFKPKDSTLNLFLYQRLFLRAVFSRIILKKLTPKEQKKEG